MHHSHQSVPRTVRVNHPHLVCVRAVGVRLSLHRDQHRNWYLLLFPVAAHSCRCLREHPKVLRQQFEGLNLVVHFDPDRSAVLVPALYYFRNRGHIVVSEARSLPQLDATRPPFNNFSDVGERDSGQLSDYSLPGDVQLSLELLERTPCKLLNALLNTNRS